MRSDLPFRIDQWDDKHPLIRPFADPQHGDLRRLAFRGYTEDRGPSGDRRKAGRTPREHSVPGPEPGREGPGGIPRRGPGDPGTAVRPGDGGVWFTSTCDRGWGEWPSSRLYLPLVHQIVGEPLGLNEGGPVRPTLIDAAAPAEARPEVARRPQSQPGHQPEPAGVGDRPVHKRRIRGTVSAHPGGEAGGAPRPPGQRRRRRALAATDLRQDEQWHWAAVVLVGLMLLESFVANRTVS